MSSPATFNIKFLPNTRYVFKTKLCKAHYKAQGIKVPRSFWIRKFDNTEVTVLNYETAHNAAKRTGMITTEIYGSYRSYAILPQWCKEIEK